MFSYLIRMGRYRSFGCKKAAMLIRMLRAVMFRVSEGGRGQLKLFSGWLLATLILAGPAAAADGDTLRIAVSALPLANGFRWTTSAAWFWCAAITWSICC